MPGRSHSGLGRELINAHGRITYQPIGGLINGTTIALYDANELNELEFFHIKLESHDVIYAEGTPCETLLAVDENAINFADYLRKYGAPTGNEAPCAPLFSYNGGRSELKSRLRSAFSPWIRD